MYIQKATLNGQLHEEFWFSHKDFSNGGNLELWLGPNPNKKWGVKELPN
jgi:putative alpha-1,2-mannosidase